VDTSIGEILPAREVTALETEGLRGKSDIFLLFQILNAEYFLFGSNLGKHHLANIEVSSSNTGSMSILEKLSF
jgi:hypothetical protein